jgi:hypothetical protein
MVDVIRMLDIPIAHVGYFFERTRRIAFHSVTDRIELQSYYFFLLKGGKGFCRQDSGGGESQGTVLQECSAGVMHGLIDLMIGKTNGFFSTNVILFVPGAK